MSATARQFRIVWPEEGAARKLADRKPLGDPRLAWTWPQFFEQWFLPGLLEPKKTAQGTIDLYGDALRYWSAITGDPEMGETSDEIAIDFVGQLPEWGYSRRGVRRGQSQRICRLTDTPAFTPLASSTIAAHVSRMATLFRRAGPRYDPRQRSAEILPRFPFIPDVTAEFETKAPFSIAVARQIYAAAWLMRRPDLPAGWSRGLWWQVRLALFYFTGLRAGTVVALLRSHVKSIDGALWLDVPGSLVRKTGKAVKMPLHPQLAGLIAQLPPAGPDELLLPPGCGYRHFLTLHAELLELANVPVEQRQSPHAWRRTHLTELGTLGLSRAFEVARVAADHSDGRTTESHYVGPAFVNMLRLRLPPLAD